MKNIVFSAAICVFASTASAQIGDYLGPGILSRGAGDIGARSGQPVQLRFFGEVTGIYDTGLQPFSADSKGNLVEVNGLYGVEATLGAYGSHQWRRAKLGLDYRGSFYHYAENSSYDGSDHNLALGYTYQKSRRMVFDFRQLAGTSSRGYGSASGLYGSAYSPISSGDIVNQPTSSLFDNRIYYLQSSMDVNLLQSARTIYTLGGSGYTVRRQSSALVGVNGYDLHGSVTHRLSKARSVGASYSHLHFDFPRAFGESDVNQAEGTFHTMLGRYWTFSISAGAVLAEVQGLRQVAVDDPRIAALFGQDTFVQPFYRKTTYPSGSANLTAHINKSSTLTLNYGRSVSPGNGVYLTSSTESATAYYSYTGIRKWNFSVSGGYNTLKGIGQGLQTYSTGNGGAGVTYGLTRAIHIVGRFDARQQAIDLAGYRRTGYRSSIGLAFSPGDVPLSLW